jgi:hypothetical protein
MPANLRPEEDKQEMKARKNEEKAAKIRNKRMSKQSNKSGDYSTPETTGAVRTTTTDTERDAAEYHPHDHAAMDGHQTDQEIPISQYDNIPAQSPQGQPDISKRAEPSFTPPASPRGVKGWLKSTFRRGSKGQKEENKRPIIGNLSGGGASATKPEDTGATDKTDAADEDDGTEEIPVAKLDDAVHDEQRNADRDASNAGVLSSTSTEEKRTANLEDDNEIGDSRDQFNEDSDVAGPAFGAQRPISPARDSRFREEI